eukprot:7040428-Alexandrium_andersonii.AAC.1
MGEGGGPKAPRATRCWRPCLDQVFSEAGALLVGIQEARSEGPTVKEMCHYRQLVSGCGEGRNH